MPSCCITGCNNSSYKGYLLRCFPRDKKRCEEWTKSINKPNFKPNTAHRVCEVHFAPEMWEKARVDGSRKLKRSAVPTLFGDDVVNKPSTMLGVSAENADKEENSSSPKSKVIFKKIIPPKTAPIVIPASSVLAKSINSKNAIIVDSRGKIVNSVMPTIIKTTGPHSTPMLIIKSPMSPLKRANNKTVIDYEGKIVTSFLHSSGVLKPVVKTTSLKSSPMLISTNVNILKNQIKTANNKTPIIIPVAKTNVSQPRLQTTTTNATTTNNTTTTNATTTTNTTTTNTSTSTTSTSPPTLKAVSPPVAVTAPSAPSAIDQQENVASKAKPIVKSEKEIANLSEVDSTPQESGENVEEASTSATNRIIFNEKFAKRFEEERFARMDKLLLKQLKTNNGLRRKLNYMNRKLLNLMKRRSNDVSFLKEVFTEDQIRSLELRNMNPKSVIVWSSKTMTKALKLKEECGSRGYEELLRQHFPLPSVKTLSRWCKTNNIPLP